MKVLTTNNKVLTVGGKALKVVCPVMWNQICSIPPSSMTTHINDVTITDNRDGSYSAITEASGATADTYIGASYPIIQDGIIEEHKYCVKGCPDGGAYATYYMYASARIGGLIDTGSGYITTATGSGGAYIVMYVKSGTIITSQIKFIPQTYDLTQMFGSGKEPTTTAQFEEWLADNGLDGYQPYNAGELRYLTKPSWL